MSANDAPPNLIDQTQGCVPRELTQARLDRRAAASALIKPADLYTLADRVEEMARSQGERPFLLYGDQRFSYAEVDARANQVAHAAFARGLQAAGYATDPNYADKLARIINGNTLRTALAASSARSA